MLQGMIDADSVFDEVCALQAEGQYLVAHDRAAAALEAGADHDGLRHRAVLVLAQAGASRSALRLFKRLGMDRIAWPEIAALGARLVKDQALLEGVPGAAQAAEEAYFTLWRRSGEAWHGVNAAAMALLDGAPDRAKARVAALGPLPDTGDYWAAATLAEASLLQGDVQACADWLTIAETRAGGDLNMRRTTRRQLRWELRLLGTDPAAAAALLELLRVPASVHFCGAIPRGPDASDPAPEAALRAQLGPALQGVRFGFGSLAAGADIVIAEMLLDAGAALTLVLPYPPDPFAAASVLLAGEGWVTRFQACLARAATVRVLEAAPQDDQDFAMASRRAMGLARLHARAIDGAAWQVAVPHGGSGRAAAVTAAAADTTSPCCDGGETVSAAAAAAGTAADIRCWRASGGKTRILASPWQKADGGARPPPPERVLKSVLFGDLPGFGNLDDKELTAFYAGPMRAVGRLVHHAAYRNAWGDAVQLVFGGVAETALCALAIQRALSADALEGWGLPPSLLPRLALDFGPLRPVEDAVQGVAKFAGRVMTRAARIEPVTPPGLVYATEAFACEVALLPDPPVACDYAGLVPTAKAFGTLPLYAVRGV